MRPVRMREDEIELRLDAAISGFADRVPLMSARNLVSPGQRNFLIGLVVATLIGLVLDVRWTITAIICRLHPALPGHGHLPRLPLQALPEGPCGRERHGRGGAHRPGFRVAVLYDPLARLQRGLGRPQADRESRPDGLSPEPARSPDPRRAGRRGHPVRAARLQPAFAVQDGRHSSSRTPHQAQGIELRPHPCPRRHRRRLRRRGHARRSPTPSSCRCVEPVRPGSGVRPGAAVVQERDAEHHHTMVHHRVRDVVLLLPPRPGDR